MATNPNELFSSATGAGSGLRCIPESVQPRTFDQGSGTLASLTPVAFNEATGFWGIYTGAVLEVFTLTADGTPASAGDFTLTINGITSGAIAFDATAAELQTALEAMPNIQPGDVACVATAEVDLGVAAAVVTTTLQGQFVDTDPVVTADYTGISGNDHVLAFTTQGSDSGVGTIDGFVWPDAVVLDSDEEVLGQVCLKGRIHRDDVPVVSASYSQAQLDVALVQLRSKGYIIEGLANFR